MFFIYLQRNQKVNELLKWIKENVLTEKCIEHLKKINESPESSYCMELYNAQRW